MSNPSNAGTQTGRISCAAPNLTQIAKGTVVLGDDFTKHRITGFVPHAQARGLDPNLDVPLITHVLDGLPGSLWQGGCMGGILLPEGFDYVLSLYPWEAYGLHEGVERDEVRMYDSLDQGFEQVEELASGVAQRLRDGQTVLVHCQAGLNRSGLLAARTLIELGKTPAESVALLRESRSPIVLCNEAFENWIAGCV